MEIRYIDKKHSEDINLKNEPFLIRGRMVVTFDGKRWHHQEILFPKEEIKEMTFPDENYDFDKMKDYIFLGAYENEECVGLAILYKDFTSRLYLSDLKVKKEYRKKGIGRELIKASLTYARRNKFNGIYTICQDNNLDACLFYLNSGFAIGGLDTKVYENTKQEGKYDILLYLD